MFRPNIAPHSIMWEFAGERASMESISSSNPLVQYKLLRQVGKGSYGKVYRALERSTNATLASQLVKRVPR